MIKNTENHNKNVKNPRVLCLQNTHEQKSPADVAENKNVFFTFPVDTPTGDQKHEDGRNGRKHGHHTHIQGIAREAVDFRDECNVTDFGAKFGYTVAQVQQEISGVCYEFFDSLHKNT